MYAKLAFSLPKRTQKAPYGQHHTPQQLLRLSRSLRRARSSHATREALAHGLADTLNGAWLWLPYPGVFSTTLATGFFRSTTTVFPAARHNKVLEFFTLAGIEDDPYGGGAV